MVNYLIPKALASLFFALILALTACGEGRDSQPEQSAATAGPDTTEQPVATPTQSRAEESTILILGNSLAAGYGLNNVEDAFPALMQVRIDSLGLAYRVVNAGVSGETTTGGKNRLDWLLRQQVDILVIELGANDGLRGIDPAETKKNLLAMVDQARAKYPDIRIVLCGMEAPPNMGQDFTARFRQLFADVAEQKDLALVPFILAGVAGKPALNQADGIHPTPEGHEILAENLWAVLGPMVKEGA